MLGGALLGAVLVWLRSAAARQAAVGERDEVFTALRAACMRLMVEARIWRGTG